MPVTSHRRTVHELLTDLADARTTGTPDCLKDLFWSHLNYDRANSPISRTGWPQPAKDALSDDPTVFATAAGDNFQVILARLASDRLSTTDERAVVEQLLKQHPYALFLFCNRPGNAWHFLNVKNDQQVDRRRLYRRITVAKGEQLRTATERIELLDIGAKPLSPLEIQNLHDDAFDVEAVTEAFYGKYDDIFQHIVEPSITGIADGYRRLFTQRLFNRLMFIAFIQKKGWLDFHGDTDYLAALWKAYTKAKIADSNFYRDRVKLLFFAGLNNPGEVDITGINRGGMLKELIGTVPYLNGGLFEEDEDEKDPAITVPDTAMGAILDDLFAHYNFTVTESTPLDVEVAVDPEMLGKVFEKLVTDRHESGSYYTPKPVVSFMCREALKGYLGTSTHETVDAIAAFVDEHQPDGLKNPESVLTALKSVKACDPACGSGAYLLGILHELLDLRACLFASKNVDPLSVYDRKLEIIQNSVYGVDLAPFAVNIARLRLWLSLAVDFEGEKPEPLPNLDFKVEQGDSLTAPSPEGALEQLGLREMVVRQVSEAKADFQKAHTKIEKDRARKTIAALKTEIAMWTHRGKGVQGFDWPVEFTEVFAESKPGAKDGGFDIVLANPPYVRQELLGMAYKGGSLKPVHPEVYSGTADLYVYFYSRAVQCLKPGGMLSFISSNKWFRAAYGAKLRAHVAEKCSVRSITDFGDLPVFDSAIAYPMIFMAQKRSVGAPVVSTVFTEPKVLDPPYPDVLAVVRQCCVTLPLNALNGRDWRLADASTVYDLYALKGLGKSLRELVGTRAFRGITTGLNDAFIIDGAARAELLAADPTSAEIIKPFAAGRNVRRWCIDSPDQWLIFTRTGTNINKYPAVRKYLSIHRPRLEPRPHDWRSEVDGDWSGRKPGPYQWYEIQDNIAYFSEFDRPKIVSTKVSLCPTFALDVSGIYLGNTAYMIPIDPAESLYLLGILNSSTFQEYAGQVFVGKQNGYYEVQPAGLESFIIANSSASDRTAIAALVEKCLAAKGVGCEAWEAEINERVARLYGV